MIGDILEEKEIELLHETYVVYLKEVASKLGRNGSPPISVIRAFVRRGKKL
ncbi:hypothetical protein J4207_01330 [Candidatus Woesearchaeota archaeon]|nr:hypothetical protein [Candidatus Woesearchaeota archaeon]